MTLKDIQRRYGITICLTHSGDIPRNWTGLHQDNPILVNPKQCPYCLQEAEATLAAVETEFLKLAQGDF